MTISISTFWDKIVELLFHEVRVFRRVYSLFGTISLPSVQFYAEISYYISKITYMVNDKMKTQMIKKTVLLMAAPVML